MIDKKITIEYTATYSETQNESYIRSLADQPNKEENPFKEACKKWVAENPELTLVQKGTLRAYRIAYVSCDMTQAVLGVVCEQARNEQVQWALAKVRNGGFDELLGIVDLVAEIRKANKLP